MEKPFRLPAVIKFRQMKGSFRDLCARPEQNCRREGGEILNCRTDQGVYNIYT